MSNQLITFETVRAAAKAASDIYEKTEELNFDYIRKVEKFRIAGELAAGVSFSKSDLETAIVTIRGTSVWGNWIFTNFQAYFRSFNVVDESLSNAPAEPYQGGYYRTPIIGSVHQGFYRAFSWLWYGTEPILGNIESNRIIGLSRLFRYAVLLLLLPLVFYLLWQEVGALIAIGAAFIFVTLENGVWEDVNLLATENAGDDKAQFRRSTKKPFQLLRELNRRQRVIFTGHSLGGAIATIAFCVYRCWCRSDDSRSDNAVLVTFGAPRVGDQTFMKNISEEHGGRFLHIVHPGDPVPELPPNGALELWHRNFWRRGVFGLFLVCIYPVWWIVALLYRNSRAARWTNGGFIELANTSSVLKFSRHNMEKNYLKWIQDACASPRSMQSITDEIYRATSTTSERDIELARS